MEPAFASDLKSSGTSSIDAGRYPHDGPDGANAFRSSDRRRCRPHARRSLGIGVPIGTSNTPGAVTSPLTPTNFIPADPLRPDGLYQSTPFTRICGTKAKVSTLLTTVGLPQRPPRIDRERRLVARLGALAFDRFDQRALFAADVAAGADEQSRRSKARSEPQDPLPEDALR